MNSLKQIFIDRGISIKSAILAGCPSARLCKHYYGQRRISAESALLYEKLLGIPRDELRPDLWPWTRDDQNQQEPVKNEKEAK